MRSLVFITIALLTYQPLVLAERLEPTITFYETENYYVYEKRQNGEVISVKIQPKDAADYYIIDANGYGDFESNRPFIAESHKMPSWILLSW